jgi:hypothetical protein
MNHAGSRLRSGTLKLAGCNDFQQAHLCLATAPRTGRGEVGPRPAVPQGDDHGVGGRGSEPEDIVDGLTGSSTTNWQFRTNGLAIPTRSATSKEMRAMTSNPLEVADTHEGEEA